MQDFVFLVRDFTNDQFRDMAFWAVMFGGLFTMLLSEGPQATINWRGVAIGAWTTAGTLLFILCWLILARYVAFAV